MNGEQGSATASGTTDAVDSTGGGPRKILRLTPEERAARGKAARNESPRRSHGRWEPAAGRPDPVALLEEQARDPGPRAGPDPLRPDAGVAVHVLPRCGADHGRRPRRHPAVGPARAALRRRPPVELRRLRLARAPADVRHQRLRRDPARAVGVGRQAAGREPRDRRPRPRVLAARTARRSSLRASAEYRDADAALRRRCATSTSGTPTSRSTKMFEQLSALATKKQRAKAEANVAKARTRDSMQAFSKLTHEVDGRRRIVADPPLIVPIEELIPADAERRDVDGELHALIRSLPPHAWRPTGAHLLEQLRVRPHRPARSSGSAASAPAPGSCCCSAATTRTRCSSRPRRPRRRCSSGSSAQSEYTQPRPAGRRRPAADAGGQRHLPRAGSASPGSTARSATSTCASCATGRAPPTSTP